MLLSAIPSLPVASIEPAVRYYTERFGFSEVHQEESFALLSRDQIRLTLWQADDRNWQAGSPPGSTPVRSGAESFLAGTASCRIETTGLDTLFAELAVHGVLHPANPEPETTWYRTREVHALDLDGNLLTFFEQLG